MISPHLLLGVDVGSSGVKAILLHPSRGIVASAKASVQQHSDRPGWSEADTAEWWSGFISTIPKLLNQAKANSWDIRGIAFSGMVPALVAINQDGTPVRRAILQNDSRAVQEIEEIKNSLSEFDSLTMVGSIPSQQWIAPTVLWLARYESENFRNIKNIVGSYDWMAHALGAELHVEKNWALESGLFTLNDSVYHEIYDSINVEWPNIPGIRRSGDQVGKVSSKASEETGLRAGTPIFVGGADHVLSAYGAGLVDDGDVLIKLGGAGDILAVSKKLILSKELYIDSHPIPNIWLPNGCMATSGSILRWEQNLLNEKSLEKLDQEANLATPGSLLVLPYFLGEKTPLHDPLLRGAILGIHLGTTRGEIHRAILESIAFGFRRHVEIFRNLNLNVNNIKITNGGSKSKLWKKIIADVLQLDVMSIVDHPGASFGAAICAGVGLGVFEDWEVGLKLIKPGEMIHHDLTQKTKYDLRYMEFIEATDSLTTILHSISGGQNEK